VRLDDLVVIGILVGVLGLDVARGAPGPSFAVGFTAVATVVYLVAGRRRAEPAPAPGPASPAVLLITRNDAAGVVGAVRAAQAANLPVFVVDDGSRDRSVHLARAAGAVVLAHSRGSGWGVAARTGMRLAARHGHTHVIHVPADAPCDPGDIAAFAASLRWDPGAVLVGLPTYTEDPNARRRANLLLQLETGWRFGDATCPLLAWPIAPVMALGVTGFGQEARTELLVRARWAGMPVRDIPCHAMPCVRRGSAAGRALTHVMLLVLRLIWPPRWPVRLRAAPRAYPREGARERPP
jgi:hypothetical protein